MSFIAVIKDAICSEFCSCGGVYGDGGAVVVLVVVVLVVAVVHIHWGRTLEKTTEHFFLTRH